MAIEPRTTNFIPGDDLSLDVADDLAATESLIERLSAADLVLEEPPPEPIGRSWLFRFDGQRGFVRTDTAEGHGPAQTSGLSTLRNWIEKCLNTERGAHPVHPPDYGVARLSDFFGQPMSPTLAADWEARIREALLFHPRIVAITNFNADQDDETLLVRWTVVLDDDSEMPLTWHTMR